MCLIAFAWDCHPRFALALIANRDEIHARPALAAAPQPDAAHVVGGRDAEAGGSWLQLSTRGRLAAVTNVRDGPAAPDRPRSRGALVVDFARAELSAGRFCATLAGQAAQFGRFNLLLWDGNAMRVLSNHPAVADAEVAPGLHALSNAALDAPWPKAVRARERLSDWLDSPAAVAAEPVLAPLFEALADPAEAADADLPSTGVPLEWERRLSAAFIRGDTYGTRCSTVVLVDRDGGLWLHEHRFGPAGVALGSIAWRGRRGE